MVLAHCNFWKFVFFSVIFNHLFTKYFCFDTPMSYVKKKKKLKINRQTHISVGPLYWSTAQISEVNSPNSVLAIRRWWKGLIHFYAVCVCSPVIARNNNIMSPPYRNGVFIFFYFFLLLLLHTNFSPIARHIIVPSHKDNIILSTHYYLVYL